MTGYPLNPQPNRPKRKNSDAGSAALPGRKGGHVRLAGLQFNLLQLDLRGRQQLLYGVELIRFLVKDAPDTGIHQHFETMDTRGVGHINIRPTDIGAVLRRLGNGIDFRVDGPVAVLFDFPGRGL